MSQALAINPDIGLREVLEVSADNNFDIVYSPVLQGPGGSIGGTFIKPSATHAGATTSYSENGGDPDALPGDASVAQLESFKNNFESAMGSNHSGMCLLQKNDGSYAPVSTRAGMYAEFADNGEIVPGTEEASMERVLQEYVQRSGNSLMTPTVY